MKVHNYMAILRNLRNIIEAGVDQEHLDKVCMAIADPEAVKRSRQLPFRFLSAYKNLPASAGKKVMDALEKAVATACENVPKLPGRTVIAVDVSGSMSSNVSAKSEIRCCEIGMMLGIIANRICEDDIFYVFNGAIEQKQIPSAGILYSTVHEAMAYGGTDMNLPFRKMIEDKIHCDRVIVISDNECNGGWVGNTVQSIADRYRKESGNNIWVHAIDLMGYGTQQFAGPKTNIIAGWSEKVFDFILLAEQGEGNLEKTIAEYTW